MSENTVADFSLPATGNHSFTLSGARGKHLVIYFYPKDNTPGCSTEAQQFRDLYAGFKKAHCEVVGISRDSLKSHENFKAKFTLPFELLSDADETVCNLFGVIKLKNMYGKQVRGPSTGLRTGPSTGLRTGPSTGLRTGPSTGLRTGIERSTFVLDKNGILRREWRGLKADGHAQEVLDFVTTLN
jgi:peroxiredoxin Q/BCP